MEALPSEPKYQSIKVEDFFDVNVSELPLSQNNSFLNLLKKHDIPLDSDFINQLQEVLTIAVERKMEHHCDKFHIKNIDLIGQFSKRKLASTQINQAIKAATSEPSKFKINNLSYPHLPNEVDLNSSFPVKSIKAKIENLEQNILIINFRFYLSLFHAPVSVQVLVKN